MMSFYTETVYLWRMGTIRAARGLGLGLQLVLELGIRMNCIFGLGGPWLWQPLVVMIPGVWRTKLQAISD